MISFITIDTLILYTWCSVSGGHAVPMITDPMPGYFNASCAHCVKVCACLRTLCVFYFCHCSPKAYWDLSIANIYIPALFIKNTREASLHDVTVDLRSAVGKWHEVSLLSKACTYCAFKRYILLLCVFRRTLTYNLRSQAHNAVLWTTGTLDIMDGYSHPASQSVINLTSKSPSL